MRAREFVTEDKSVHTGKKPNRSAEYAMPGAHRVAGTTDRMYDLNRIMMAVACADGTVQPEINDESWGGRNNTSHPYTKIEADMLKAAYKAMGVPWQDAVSPNPNNKSMETPARQAAAVSPIKPFKGYPR